MKQRDKDDIEIRLSVLRSNAEELHALLLDEYPELAGKFERIGRFAGKLHTCLRVHGQLPDTPPEAPVISIAKGIAALQKRLPKKV